MLKNHLINRHVDWEGGGNWPINLLHPHFQTEFSMKLRIRNGTCPKPASVHHPTGSAVGLSVGSCGTSPCPSSLRDGSATSRKTLTKSLSATYIAVCVGTQEQREGRCKRTCLCKKIAISFEDSFQGIEFLLKHAIFTLSDNSTEAMGDWRILKNFAK